MKIFIYDKINIQILLIKQGSLKDLMSIKKLKDKFKISKEDIKFYNIRFKKNQNQTSSITWDEKKDLGVEMEFTQEEVNLIKRSLDYADKENRIPTDFRFLRFYEEFSKLEVQDA